MVARNMNRCQAIEAYKETDICNSEIFSTYKKGDHNSKGWVPVLAFPVSANAGVTLKKAKSDEENLDYSSIENSLNSNIYDVTNNGLTNARKDTVCGSALNDNKIGNTYGDCDIDEYDVTGNLQNENISLPTYDHIKMDDTTDGYPWHVLIPEDGATCNEQSI